MSKFSDRVKRTVEKVEDKIDDFKDKVKGYADFNKEHPEIKDTLDCVTDKLYKAAKEKDMSYYYSAHEECFVLQQTDAPKYDEI